MIKYFRNIFYSVVFIGISGLCTSAYSGSFEDFFIAIRNDNVGKLSNLLQRGFDPNTRNEKGQPGLTVAMQEQSPKVARMLVDQPTIDVNALNLAGESALMIAAIKGDLASVKLLLDRGARVSQPGWTALHYAASGREPSTVEWLLDRGAEVDALSPNGSTPLMMAAQYGSEASVDLLLARGANMALRNQQNLGAIDFARSGGRDYLVRKLERMQRP